MVRHTVSAALAAVMLCGAGSAAIAQQAPVVGGSTPPLVSQAEDSVLWTLAERRGTADAYRSYLSAFPNGLYAATARERLAGLEGGAGESGTIPAPVVRPGPDATGSPAEAARAEAEAGLGTNATESALGLSRDDRMAIQRRLTALGHDTRGVDGAFGSGTRRAIAAWQRSRGLPETGYLTRAQADELRRAGTAPTPTGDGSAQAEAGLNLTREDRAAIQRRLSALGYDTRGADGIFGSGTRRAIAAWQQAGGLSATGYLSRAQADALRSGGTAAPAPDAAESAARTELALNLTREDRMAVQRRLTDLGYGTRGIDGDFGSGTRRAISAWQAGRGASATGYLTADQFRDLRGAVPAAVPAGGATSLDEARLGLSAANRVEVQTRLSALGYDPRGIDGKFGAGTRRAIAAWQGDNGLAATGYLDAGQLARLRDQRRGGN